MNKHGDFIWYELVTGDAAAAQAFYGDVVGWRFSDFADGGSGYRLFSAGEAAVGGLLELNDAMRADGARPGWLGYVAVDDVDASVARIEGLGGQVMMPAEDIEGVGRMALVADPQGAPFYVMRGSSDQRSDSFASDAPRVGHCAWNELSSTDPAAAWDFYETEFGWTRDGALEMGPLGQYEFVRHDHMLGAIMPKMPEMPVPAWTYYFRVPDIDAAAARVEAGGGQVLSPPMEIPGGDYSMSGIDPQGAAFALVGARVAAGRPQ